MCACRQKKSFLIADILGDSTKNKPYKNLSTGPKQPLTCSETTNASKIINNYNVIVTEDKEISDQNQEWKITKNHNEINNRNKFQFKTIEEKVRQYESDDNRLGDVELDEERIAKFNVICQVQKELGLNKAIIEQRRNTYPLYPGWKTNVPWTYKLKGIHPYRPLVTFSRYPYASESYLHSNQILRRHMAHKRFLPNAIAFSQNVGLNLREKVFPERVAVGGWQGGWWGLRGRKGGQVRFTSAQTSALEGRFVAHKYLSPDERRALADQLRLSDRQVKTWFQNRRAKWRRAVPNYSEPERASDDDDEPH